MKPNFMILPLLCVSVVGHAFVHLPNNSQSKCSDTCSDTTTKCEPQFYQFHNRIVVFAPSHQCYERIKTDAVYTGIEAYCASVLNKDHHNMYLDAEFRMGYNFFFNGRDHFTPLLGVGYLQDFFTHHNHSRHRPGVMYATTGFLYEHEFTPYFDLGLNAKFIIGGPIGHNKYAWGSPVVGMDAALPITFRFGYHHRWDLRIEPFDTLLRGSRLVQNYFGFRSTIGFRF